MNIRSLLTIHTIDQPVENLKPAVETAVAMGAHLDIVIIGIEMAPPADIHGAFPSDYWQEYNREISGHIDTRKEAVKALLANHDIESTTMAEASEMSELGHLVLTHALCSDLILLSRKDISTYPALDKAFSTVLFDSGRPVLLLNDDPFDPAKLKNAVLGWDCSAEAANAAHLALPLLSSVEALHVTVVDPDPARMGANPGDDIALFFSRHSVSAEVNKLPSENRNAGEALSVHAGDKNAGLLVMGAYGHSRLREWLLGGATRSVLDSASVPVLMAH